MTWTDRKDDLNSSQNASLIWRIWKFMCSFESVLFNATVNC